MRTFCTLFFVFLHVVLGMARDVPNLNFQDVPGKAQLSSQFSTCITQDQTGYIWIGTVDGLNRYDGQEIKTFRNTTDRYSGLINNNIRTIFSDSKNRLWIGTVRGLSIYYPKRDTFEVLSSSNNPAGLENSFIYQISESADGVFYVAAGKSIYTYNEDQKSFSKLLEVEDEDITSFCFGKDDAIWVGQDGGGGLKRFIAGDYQNSQMPSWMGKQDSAALAEKTVMDIQTSDGLVWVATRGGGLKRIDNQNRKIKTYLTGEGESFVVDVYQDNSGDLWTCDFSGLKFYDSENDEFHPYYPEPENENSIKRNPVGILQDHQNNYWVIYSEKGFDFSPVERGFQLYDDSSRPPWQLNDHNIMAISEDARGHLWAGGYNEGISVFRWDENTTTTFEYSPDDTSSVGEGTIFDIHLDSNDDIWVASYHSGLQKYDPSSNGFTTHKHKPGDEHSINGNDIRSIAEDSLGNFWLAVHGEGVDYFDKRSGQFRHFTPENSNLSIEWTNQVFVDSRNTLWVATSYGLNKMEAGRDSFDVFLTHETNSSGSLASNEIVCLHETPDGSIWVGTTNGLYRYNANDETFDYYSEAFNSQYICSIEHDSNGDLWVSTHKGLAKYEFATDRVFNFDNRDGLQSNDFNIKSSYFDGEQYLFFGGPGGVNAFDPGEINFNMDPPRVVFTELRLFNEKVTEYGDDQPLEKHISAADQVTLEYDNNLFTIEFAAINYLNPEKNQYAYRLEGFENRWNKVGNKREATYTNLDPGTYTFRVKAANNDGIWNEEGGAIEVVVLPPWYMTLWFQILAVFLTAGLIYFAIRIRTSVLRRQKAALTELINERTKKLHEKNQMLKNRTLELNNFNQQLEEQKETIEEQALELKKSNKELQNLNSTKNRLFSIIAHDVRSPFNTIIGFSSLLKEMADDDNNSRVKKYAQYIYESSHQVLSLLENLLYWARSQTNEITFNPRNTSLKKISEDNIKLLKESASRKEMKIDASNLDYNIELEGDEDMLRTIVRNFLSNAIKFTPRKGKITLESKVENYKLTFLINDSGKGMKSREVEQLKNSGTINSTPGTAGEKGSGLGLVISKEFIDRHNGEMIIRSSPGKGSTFGFTIPLNQSK
ncbi:MAG: two-component regulator propeller domain-containing protein [Marinilabilia sp.]